MEEKKKDDNGDNNDNNDNDHSNEDMTKKMMMISAEGIDWNQALLKATRKGDMIAITEALENGADIECRSKAASDTPLMMAAYYGHYECLKVFLGRRANVNALSRSGQTALMLAATKGHKDCVTNLLNRSASIELHSSGNGYTALICASRRYQHECVHILLENGADINAITNTKVKNEPSGNMSALHYAAYKNDSDTVQCLMKHSKVNPQMRDTNQCTPKDYAKKDVQKFFDTSTKAYRDLHNGTSKAKKTQTVAEASAKRSIFQWRDRGGVYKLKREYKIQNSTLVKR